MGQIPNNLTNPLKTKWRTKWLLCLVIATLSAVLDLAFRIPIYVDEIAYKILNARYFLDKTVSITVYPQCRPSFNQSKPTIFLLLSLLESLIYGELTNLLKLRIGSLFYLALIFYLLYAITHHSLKDVPNWNKTKSLIWIFCLHSLGLSPFFMILNRPELPMLLSILVVYLVQLKIFDKPYINISPKSFAVFSYLFALITFYFYHPKALLFLPVFVVACCFIFESLAQKLSATVLTFYVASQNYNSWRYQYTCPLDSKLNMGLNEIAISKIDYLHNLWELFFKLTKNLIGSKHLIVSSVFSGGGYSFIPNLGTNGVINDITTATLFKLWNYSFYLLFVILGWQIIKALCICFHPKNLKLNKQMKNCTFLALLFSLLLICSGTYRKPVYDNTLIFPIFFLCALFSLSLLPQESKNKVVEFIFRFIIVLFFSSSLILLGSFSKFRENFLRGGPIDGIMFGHSGFNSGIVNQRVQNLALKCGIDSKSKLTHLIVDEISYPSFWNSTEPYFAIFIFWMDSDSRDKGIESFLKTRNSSGYIGRCRYLPPHLESKALRDQEICCLPHFNQHK